MKLIDTWHPRRCKTEKDLERSLHKHLEKNLPDTDVQMQYASGRVKGDICVDHKVLIELKDGLKSTAQVQRLLGQLDLFESQWKKEVIVIICGDSQRDLVRQIEATQHLRMSPALLEKPKEKKLKIENFCLGCAAVPRPTDEHLKTLVPFGDPVRNEGGFGRARWLEITTSHKCPKCGALWENLVESGATGHGNSWNRIDSPPSK